jgi:two-component sensor histidine kinase
MQGPMSLELDELRHRLLGNFQLLQALISIRLRDVDDPESRRHLNWLNDVVASLALLNRRLAATGLADFPAYLIECVGFWRRVCTGREIGFSLEATQVATSETLSSSLALIVHELIANAVEHAFPDGRGGRIAVTLSTDKGFLTLSVSDNGSARVVQDVEGAQGLKLARGLAEHLGGSFELRADRGMTVTVRVPLNDKTPDAGRRAH